MDIAGEHRHNDASLRLLEVGVERLADLALGHGVARPLDVGGFAQERQHALAAQLRHAAQVGPVIVDGGVVNLEVSRMHDCAPGRMNRQRNRARDGVIDMKKLDGKDAQLDGVARLDHMQLYAVDAMLLELVLHQRQRQPRSIDGRRQRLEHIGSRADVILVPVGDDIPAELGNVLFQIGCVGNNQVNARHILPGEYGADVHHDDVIPIFKYRHVFAYFAKAAQRYNAQLWLNPSSCHNVPPLRSF